MLPASEPFSVYVAYPSATATTAIMQNNSVATGLVLPIL